MSHNLYSKFTSWPCKKPLRFPRIWKDNPYRITPDQLNIGMTGSVYDTKVERKRKITDINVPKLERGAVESIAWPKWKILRDIRRRYVYSYHFPLKNALNTIKKNYILPEVLKENAHSEICDMPRDFTVKRLTNRCVLTGRARGNNHMWRVSRHSFRKIADDNCVSGILKAFWGP